MDLQDHVSEYFFLVVQDAASFKVRGEMENLGSTGKRGVKCKSEGQV